MHTTAQRPALSTNEVRRRLATFAYINGQLFAERTRTSDFDSTLRQQLLAPPGPARRRGQAGAVPGFGAQPLHDGAGTVGGWELEMWQAKNQRGASQRWGYG